MGSFTFICFISMIFHTFGCLIDIEKLNYGTNQPIFLERGAKGLRLATPTFINWKTTLDIESNTVIIACPGIKNYIVYGDEVFGDRLEGTCTIAKSGRNTIMQIQDKMYNIYKFRCKDRMQSFEIAPNKALVCGVDNSAVYKIGYVVNDELFPLMGACHNETTGRTHWTRHRLLGISMSGADSNYTKPVLINNNEQLFKKIRFNSAFMARNQREKIASILGKDLSKKIMRRNIEVFTKTLLVPAEDFKIDTWKDVAFHYINVGFQWMPIYTGVWKSLEIEIRKLGKIYKWDDDKMEQDLTILTGGTGVLELPDEKGELQIISMGNKPERLDIPKYFWKIVQSKDYSCIGFITTNFPPNLIQNDDLKDCTACYNYGWRKLIGKDYNVKCCDYSKLKTIVPEIPLLKCDDILEFKNKRD